MAPTLMASLITPARVISRLRTRDVRHVVDELTGLATDGAAQDHAAARLAVLERRRSSCFGFGRGVAIPHAALPGLARPIGVFARLRPAQDFGASDDIPADLVVLLLSPAGDDPTHLRALARVARRLRDREVAARLRSAKDAQAIHAVLTSDAWREPEAGSGHPAPPQRRDLTNASECRRLKASC